MHACSAQPPGTFQDERRQSQQCETEDGSRCPDHGRHPALPQAMTCHGKRHGVRRVSVMRSGVLVPEARQFEQLPGQPWTVFGQTQHSKVTVPKNCGCQGVSPSPTVMNTQLVKFHTVFLPEISEGPPVLNDVSATPPATPGG